MGAPVPLFHAHQARLMMAAEGRGASIVRERMVLSLTERAGNIWMAEWKGGW